MFLALSSRCAIHLAALWEHYTSSSSGKIDIPDLLAGKYTVKEVDLSSDFVAPTPNLVTVEVKPGQTASVSFDNVKKRGVLTVQKTNANPLMGDYSLKGAEFEVRDQGGNLVDTIIVDESGRGSSKILPLGVYQIRESKSPYGFVRDKNTYTATLSGTQGNTAIVYAPHTSIAEQPQAGKINIYKYNETPEMGDYDLSGAVFEILDGEVLLEGLLVGNYKVQELESELTAGYVLSEEESAVVAPDQLTQLTIHNELQYGALRLIKIFEGQEKPIAGVPFHIFGTSLVGMEYDEVLKTNDNGEIFVKLPVGEYRVEELSSDKSEGYKLLDAQTIIIKYDDTKELAMENKLIRGDVKLIKVGENGERLAGAVFDLYNPAGEKLGEYQCDENGEIQVKGLPYGKGYKWVETAAPAGHTGVGTEYVFDITEENATVEVLAMNARIPQTGDDGAKHYMIAFLVSLAALITTAAFSRRNRVKRTQNK